MVTRVTICHKILYFAQICSVDRRHIHVIFVLISCLCLSFILNKFIIVIMIWNGSRECLSFDKITLETQHLFEVIISQSPISSLYVYKQCIFSFMKQKWHIIFEVILFSPISRVCCNYFSNDNDYKTVKNDFASLPLNKISIVFTIF